MPVATSAAAPTEGTTAPAATESATTTTPEGEGGVGGAKEGAPAGADSSTAAEGTPPAEAPPAGEQPPAAEGEGEGGDKKYELQLPDGAALSQAQLERIAAHARERGLSQEQAQSLAGFMDTERKEMLSAMQPGGEEWTRQVGEWEKQTLADTTLGKTEDERRQAIQRGQRVLERYAEAHPDRKANLVEFLNNSGLGNHPAVAHLFSWLGQSVAEGDIPTTAGVGGAKLTEDDRLRAMYPSMYRER